MTRKTNLGPWFCEGRWNGVHPVHSFKITERIKGALWFRCRNCPATCRATRM